LKRGRGVGRRKGDPGIRRSTEKNRRVFNWNRTQKTRKSKESQTVQRNLDAPRNKNGCGLGEKMKGADGSRGSCTAMQGAFGGKKGDKAKRLGGKRPDRASPRAVYLE